jgi:hypothetical protein
VTPGATLSTEFRTVDDDCFGYDSGGEDDADGGGGGEDDEDDNDDSFAPSVGSTVCRRSRCVIRTSSTGRPLPPHSTATVD